MGFAVSGQNRRVLLRGAAVILIGGLTAGCSSGAMRFEDLAGPQASVSNQQYSGSAYGVDPTATGSISSAPRQGGLLNRLTPRPRQDLGGQYAAAPSQNSWQNNSAPQPVYSAPASPVSAGPALAPVMRSSLDPAPAVPPAARHAESRPSTASGAFGQTDQVARVPTPTKAPDGRVVNQSTNLTQTAQLGPQSVASGAQAAAAGNVHKVASGDTLHSVSRKYQVSVDSLKRANGLSDGNIRIGQTLTIPGAGAASAPVQVVAAPKPATAAVTPETPKPEVATYTPPKKAELPVQQAAIDRTTPAPNATGISSMRWPVRGRVISGFSASGAKKNDGIDIAVPAGTPIKAAENGVVIYAGDGLKEFGNTVLVRHENGLVTVYGHASELKVQRGQKVRRGEDIALAGMSGSAEMPKLHFEVRKDSTPVDPSKYLE